MRFLFLFSLLLQLSLAYAQETSEEYQQGWFAFQAKDYVKAAQIWKNEAEKGDIKAALGLAAIYENGLGTTRDPVQSAHWYQMAADQGSPEAQHDLGIKYFTGNGVRQDRNKAFMLWKTAAEQGLGVAQAKTGYMYHQGIGTQKDMDKAISWYRQGALQNDPESMYNLGLMYGSGTGVEQDESQFLHLLQLAAEKDHTRAQLDLGLMALHGRIIEKNVPFGETMLQRSAEGGFVDAQYYLGTLYRSGEILTADEEKARYYLKMAASRGHSKAKTELNELDRLNQLNPDLYSKKSDRQMTAYSKAETGISATNKSTQGKTTASPSVSRSISTSKTIRDANWILKQDPSRYIAQLISFSSLEAAQQYAKALEIDDEIIVYKIDRNGKSLFNVVAGTYGSYDEATNAIRRYPEKQQKLKPWVRKLKTVQPLIQ
jgi:TPR repeat protein